MKEFSKFILDVISIHTPARGVTRAGTYRTAYITISIHTPARGVTPETFSVWNNHTISIHTPARGVTAKMHIKASSLLLHFYIFYTNIYCISIASQTKN